MLFVVDSENSLRYVTSRAFDNAQWDKLQAPAGGAVAVAVPTRDWVLFLRADRADMIVALQTLAGESRGVNGIRGA